MDSFESVVNLTFNVTDVTDILDAGICSSRIGAREKRIGDRRRSIWAQKSRSQRQWTVFLTELLELCQLRCDYRTRRQTKCHIKHFRYINDSKRVFGKTSRLLDLSIVQLRFYRRALTVPRNELQRFRTS